MNQDRKLGVAITGYLALVCFVLAINPSRPPNGHFYIGLLLGSLFAFTVLPAAWTAFGPGPRLVRWPLAFLMLVAVPLSFSVSMPVGLTQLLFCQTAIVVLILIVASLLRFQFGIRLIQSSESASLQTRVAVKQYGIRHLMIITAIIAVLLSVGRVVVPWLGRLQTQELPVFVFLAFTSCVIVVPFFFSLLALRDSFWPTIVIVGFSILATWNESALLTSLKLSGPDFFHFVWINFFTVLPVILVASGLKKCGYRLIGPPKAAAAIVEVG